VKCYYVTARCHNSYRKNDSPHSVECDIVMTDTSSSQQREGERHCIPPAKMLGDASPPVVHATVTISLKLSLCCTISETFSVKKRHDLETGVRGRSRSLKMEPIDRSYDFLLIYLVRF